MNRIASIFVGLFWLFATGVAVAPDTLRMVNVLYRHGDRSPVGTYPKDPNRNLWPDGLSWLTTVGMQQQYHLGQFLRSEYGNLLSQRYNHTEIHVEASDANRTLMSAYCNLAGLYPPQGAQRWDVNIAWQPIPVHTRPGHQDNYMALVENCPNYDKLYAQEMRSPVVQNLQKENQDFFNYIENHTGLIPANIEDAWVISDSLFCSKAHNLPMPAWAEEKWENGTVYDKLRDLEEFGFNLLYNGTELSRLKGGVLLHHFISNMRQMVDKVKPYKMYMYSAHDATIAAVSNAMKVFNRLFPPYATALLVEMHQVEDGQFCVKLRYRNETTAPPYTLIHPDCQKDCCPLEEFVAVNKAEIPEHWMEECGYPIFSIFPYMLTIGILVGICLTLLLFLFLAVCKMQSVKRGYIPLA